MENVQSKKVLLVEDEHVLRVPLKIKLEKEGYTVFEAGDGIEGLEISFKEHPDMVLLDILMPNMDGLEYLVKLRKDPWGKDAQVILLTNVSNEKKANEAMKYGIKDYLIKANVTLEEIVKRVNSYFE